jgi:hypothetical protein
MPSSTEYTSWGIAGLFTAVKGLFNNLIVEFNKEKVPAAKPSGKDESTTESSNTSAAFGCVVHALRNVPPNVANAIVQHAGRTLPKLGPKAGKSSMLTKALDMQAPRGFTIGRGNTVFLISTAHFVANPKPYIDRVKWLVTTEKGPLVLGLPNKEEGLALKESEKYAGEPRTKAISEQEQLTNMAALAVFFLTIRLMSAFEMVYSQQKTTTQQFIRKAESELQEQFTEIEQFASRASVPMREISDSGTNDEQMPVHSPENEAMLQAIMAYDRDKATMQKALERAQREDARHAKEAKSQAITQPAQREQTGVSETVKDQLSYLYNAYLGYEKSLNKGMATAQVQKKLETAVSEKELRKYLSSNEVIGLRQQHPLVKILVEASETKNNTLFTNKQQKTIQDWLETDEGREIKGRRDAHAEEALPKTAKTDRNIGAAGGADASGITTVPSVQSQQVDDVQKIGGKKGTFWHKSVGNQASVSSAVIMEDTLANMSRSRMTPSDPTTSRTHQGDEHTLPAQPPEGFVVTSATADLRRTSDTPTDKDAPIKRAPQTQPQNTPESGTHLTSTGDAVFTTGVLIHEEADATRYLQCMQAAIDALSRRKGSTALQSTYEHKRSALQTLMEHYRENHTEDNIKRFIMRASIPRTSAKPRPFGETASMSKFNVEARRLGLLGAEDTLIGMICRACRAFYDQYIARNVSDPKIIVLKANIVDSRTPPVLFGKPNDTPTTWSYEEELADYLTLKSVKNDVSAEAYQAFENSRRAHITPASGPSTSGRV